MKTSAFVRQLQARSVPRAALLDSPAQLAASQAALAARQAIPRPRSGRQHYDSDEQVDIARQLDVQRQPPGPKVPPAAPSPGASKLERHSEQQAHEAQPTSATATVDYERDELDLSFNNTTTSYKSKTLGELVRNYFVLGLCSKDLLVRNNERAMRLARAILGKRGFDLAMRSTFYGQFVAGADEQEIVPVVKHLSSFGVKTILDYSAEEDVKATEPKQHDDQSVPCELQHQHTNSESEYLAKMDEDSPLRRYQSSGDFAERRKYLPVARTYFYHGESQCERNLEIFFRAIEAVAKTTGNTGFAAIKLTALGRPKLLMKLSKIIDYMGQREGYRRYESLDDLLKRFNSLQQRDINPLDEDEEEMLFNLLRRVDRIAAYASQVGGARCMIDAEQTYMQPAINLIAMQLMRQYNRREPIIFNTYQCYLKGTYDQVRRDLATARHENFFFGAKLVRGAYMEQERARAKELGYEDPINESYEATSRMYERTLTYLIQEIQRELKLSGCHVGVGAGHPSQLPAEMAKRVAAGNAHRRISIMVASHNEDAVRYTIEQMHRYGIRPDHRLICFGQLYGMCDHISFALGQAGYSVYKYAPYGPLEEVLPYLGRRAIENHGFLSKLERERNLLSKEILSRITSLRWFYKPVGNYKPV